MLTNLSKKCFFLIAILSVILMMAAMNISCKASTKGQPDDAAEEDQSQNQSDTQNAVQDTDQQDGTENQDTDEQATIQEDVDNQEQEVVSSPEYQEQFQELSDLKLAIVDAIPELGDQEAEINVSDREIEDMVNGEKDGFDAYDLQGAIKFKAYSESVEINYDTAVDIEIFNMENDVNAFGYYRTICYGECTRVSDDFDNCMQQTTIYLWTYKFYVKIVNLFSSDAVQEKLPEIAIKIVQVIDQKYGQNSSLWDTSSPFTEIFDMMLFSDSGETMLKYQMVNFLGLDIFRSVFYQEKGLEDSNLTVFIAPKSENENLMTTLSDRLISDKSLSIPQAISNRNFAYGILDTNGKKLIMTESGDYFIGTISDADADLEDIYQQIAQR